MDKYEKAKAYLQIALNSAAQSSDDYGVNQSGFYEVRTALEAVDKQIGESLIMETADDREFEDYMCPNCKTTLEQVHKNSKKKYVTCWPHCQHCGQKIKSPFERKTLEEESIRKVV